MIKRFIEEQLSSRAIKEKFYKNRLNFMFEIIKYIKHKLNDRCYLACEIWDGLVSYLDS